MVEGGWNASEIRVAPAADVQAIKLIYIVFA